MMLLLSAAKGLSMAWRLMFVWLVLSLCACVTGTVELDVSVEDGVGECSCPRKEITFTCRVTGLIITMSATPFSSDPVTFSFSDNLQTISRSGFTVRLVEVTPAGSGGYIITAELTGTATEDLVVTCTNQVETNQTTLCLIDDSPQQPSEDGSPELVVNNDVSIATFFWNDSGMVQTYAVDVLPNLPGEVCEEFRSIEATLACCGVERVVDLCETSYNVSIPNDAVSVNISVSHNISVVEFIRNVMTGTDSMGSVAIAARTCDQESEPLIFPFDFTSLLVLPDPAVGPGTSSPQSPVTTVSEGTPTTPDVTMSTQDPPIGFDTSSQSGLSIGATIGIVGVIVIAAVVAVIAVIAAIKVYWIKKSANREEEEDRHPLTCFEGGEQTSPHSPHQEGTNLETPAKEGKSPPNSQATMDSVV